MGETVVGEVIHLDHYGNIATNIPSEMLTHLVPGQWLTLTLAERTHVLPFVETYELGRRSNPSVLSTVMMHAKLPCLMAMLPPAWQYRSATVSSSSRGVR